jgi:hypothetical protein
MIPMPATVIVLAVRARLPIIVSVGQVNADVLLTISTNFGLSVKSGATVARDLNPCPRTRTGKTTWPPVRDAATCLLRRCDTRTTREVTPEMLRQSSLQGSTWYVRQPDPDLRRHS